MPYQVNFGSFTGAASRPAASKDGSFRIALLGDFSAGASRGRLETGSALAGRKGLRVDCDNVDDLIKRLKIKLNIPLTAEGAPIEVAIGSMDDFHPEQLFENLEIFTELSGLRGQLKNKSTFAKAAATVQSWSGTARGAAQPAARGSVIPVDAKLADFSRLVGRPSAAADGDGSVSELLKQMVGPYIVAAKDPQQDALVARVDEALSGTMRSVLHQPDFQALEALWRSVDFIVRRLETDESLQVVLYDISAEELAADLSTGESLENTGLYQLLVEQPTSDADQGPFSAVVGLYTFQRTPPHADLLGRLAKVAAQSSTAVFTAMDVELLNEDPKDLHSLVKDAWTALKEAPESAYLGLVSPRFLLRLPYGDRTESVDCFDFEEFTPATGLRGMLWGNPGVIVATLLGQSFTKNGAKLNLGSVMGVGDMPFYYFEDKDGDQVALPCTERLMTSRVTSLLTTQGFMPLVCMKGAPEVRLGSFNAIMGKQVAGPWAPVAVSSVGSASPASAPAAAPEMAAPAAEAAPEPAAAPTPAAEPASDPDLDALLADLGAPAPAPAAAAPGAEPEMDPDLAALLGDLK